jgi:type I restriction enzyme S subunit
VSALQTERPLGELCEFQRGLTYGKSDEVALSESVVLRANNIDLATNSLDLSELRYIAPSVQVPESKRVRAGALLICTASGSKSHLGKVAYVDADYCYAFGGFMGQLVPAKGVEGRYLFHALTSPRYKSFIDELSDGLNINNLKFDDLRRFQIPVPGVEEQRRIVAILDEAFEGIATAKAHAERNLRNAREVFDGRLQAACTRRGSECLGASLAEVCDINSMLIDPRDEQYLDLPHVGAGNIESKTGTLVDVMTAREEQLISGKFLFDDAAVLYSKIRPYLMKVVRPDFVGLCSADIYPLVPKQGLIDRDYLYYLLLSPSFTDYAIEGSARAGMPKVNREHLFAFRFPLPPVDQQKRIAANLDALSDEVRRFEVVVRGKLTALDELKQSLLHQAFSGQL